MDMAMRLWGLTQIRHIRVVGRGWCTLGHGWHDGRELSQHLRQGDGANHNLKGNLQVEGRAWWVHIQLEKGGGYAYELRSASSVHIQLWRGDSLVNSGMDKDTAHFLESYRIVTHALVLVVESEVKAGVLVLQHHSTEEPKNVYIMLTEPWYHFIIKWSCLLC